MGGYASRVRLLGDMLWALGTVNRCQGRAVALIRPDGIGDYVLFRPVLPLVRAFFADRPLVICANEVWMDFAVACDGHLAEHWLAVNRQAFKTSATYRAHWMQRARACDIELALNPLYSRDVLADCLCIATGAADRVGFRGDATNQPVWMRAITRHLYTRCLDAPTEPCFEMERSRFWVERVLGQPVSLPPVALPADMWDNGTQTRLPTSAFAVFCLGAAHPAKRWPAEHFILLAGWLWRDYGLALVLCGGEDVRPAAQTIHAAMTATMPVTDLTATTALAAMPGVLRQARLVVSHDTGLYHMALACDTPSVCIANGIGWQRFTPWPEHLAPHGRCINADGAIQPLGAVTPHDVYKEIQILMQEST